MKPLVAIALAAYEPEIGIFREQLDSIVAQTLRDWVCVIGIDGDAAALTSRPEIADLVADRRFVWHANPERYGHRRNFERTIALAASLDPRWIATADQDDVWRADKLERLVERAGPLSLVHSDMELLRDGRIEQTSVWRAARQGVDRDRLADIVVCNVVTGCTMLFDAELARRHPVIPDSFSYHDHWFAALASATGGIHRVEEPLVRYRQHGANVVGTREFDWGVRLPGRGGIRGEIDACAARWRTVRARLDDLAAEGVRPGALARLALRSRADLGLLSMLKGAALAFRSPKLSRYLVRLGIGKLASTLGMASSAGARAEGTR